MSLKKSFFFLLFFTMSQQACGEGCLMCGDEDKCLVCNYTLGYQNSIEGCKRSYDTKCINHGVDGQCLLCNQGYILDKTTSKCRLATQAITNCHYYLANGQCQYCDTGYYPFESTCLKVENQISNCLYYQDKMRCGLCDYWYTLSSDFKSCTRDPEIEKCVLQTNFNCQECKAGYYLNNNNYIEKVFKQTESQKIYNFLLDLNKKHITNIIPDPCQKILHDHCDKVTDAYKCTDCENNYYLTQELICKVFPAVKIKNCLIYQKNDTCLTCENGYFLNNNKTECKAHTQKPANCETFSQTTDNVCLKCTDDYYLNANVCVIRVQSLNINNCTTRQIDDDRCSSCASGFHLTSDKLKCIGDISNCLTYNISSKDTASELCQKCGNQTVINDDRTQCVSGTISNCETYVNAETCEQCINTYYLKDNACVKQVDLTNCQTYSGITPKQCSTCIDGHFNFSLQNHCAKADTIANCKRYSAKAECSECVEQYFLKDKVTCTPIPTEENCLRKNAANTQCVKCKQTHFLWQNACYPHFHYQEANCLTRKTYADSSTGHVNKLMCDKCKTNFVWRQLSGVNLCINKERIPQADLITNCVRYTKVDSKYICQQCAAGKFLSDVAEPTCLDTCDGPQQVKLTFDTDGNSNKLSINNSQTNVCITANKNKVYSANSKEADMMVIAKCDAGKFGVYSNEQTTYDINQKLFSNAKVFPVYSSCEDQTQKTTLPDVTKPEFKCQHYHQKGVNQNNFYCVSCQLGWTGKVAQDADGNTYLMCDKEINGCSSQRLGGFTLDKTSLKAHGLNTSDFYSCHQCAVGYIPFLFAPINDKKVQYQNFKPFNMDNLNPQSAGGDDLQVQCLIPVASSFQMSDDQFTLSFPANCGLGLFDTSQKKDFTKTPKSLFCAECAPGYKKVIDADSVVTQCKAIPNCDPQRTDKWFNSCSKCLNTHTWAWSSAKGIHYDECIQKSVQNCLVSENKNNVQTCIYCEKGYDLIDDQCEQYSVAKCNSFLANKIPIQRNSVTTTLEYDNFWLIATLQHNQGCQSCVSDQSYNYVTVQGFFGNHEACVGSYIKNNFKDLKFTGVIPHCTFQDGSKTACLECSQGYILRQEGQECITDQSYNNCTLINANNKCVSCKTGYYLILSQCVRGNIPNCMTYDDSSAEQKCVMCAQNYRPGPHNKSCVLGYLKHCKYYENKAHTSCQECDSSGLIFKYKVTTEDRNLCFLPIDDMNCEALNTPKSGDLTQNYKCNVCKPGYYLTTDQTLYNRSKCLSLIGYDSNCIKYSTSQNNYFGNNFQCLQCSADYYVGSYGYHCHKRTVSISNCSEYNLTSQTCSKCVENFFVDSDGQSCVQYPTGVQGCTNYANDSTCVACAEKHYLEDNTCKPVPNETLIKNCRFYSAKDQCKSCDTNTILSSNKCLAPNAKNCVTFTDVNTCETCPNGKYYLKKDEETKITSCVFNNITNCVQLNVNTGKCSLCSNQYFVNENGDCQLADFINNCTVYLSKNQCKKCEDEYYVSENKQSCEIQGAGILHDMPNCKVLVYEKQKQCTVCEPGHYFIQDKCESCKAGEGCQVCDWRKPEECLICQDGYHQKTKRGQCSKTAIQEFDKIPEEEKKSVFKVAIFNLLGFLMILSFF